MKWLATQNDQESRAYELREKGDKLLTLAYYPKSGRVRIWTSDEQRVFFAAREGFRRSRIAFRNEYGVIIGQLSEGVEKGQRTIEMSGGEYTGILKRKEPLTVAILKNGESLVQCEFPELSPSNVSGNDRDLLIICLCWYITSTVGKLAKEYA